MSTRPEQHDALVVGGGLAGASLALLLARAGQRVVLVEKSRAAHLKVCGEFLSHEALGYLSALGLEVDSLGAVPIHAVRLAGRNGVVASADLPFAARSLSRERLDEALLEKAGAAGATILRGSRALSLERRAEGNWEAKLAHGAQVCGDEAFLATGKHDLQGWNRAPGRHNDLVAFKMYWRLAREQRQALAGHVELALFPDGYAGLQPVEDGMANLCLLLTRPALRALGGSWDGVLRHLLAGSRHLAARLRGATPTWARPLTLAAIPYGLVRQHTGDGLWRLGDQSAVIPSFAGDGMSIALHSAQLAAALVCAGGDAAQFQQALARHVSRQVGLATTFSRALVSAPALLTLGAGLWPGSLRRLAGSTRIRRADLVAAERLDPALL